MLGRRGPRVALRAVLLLLAGTAAFALSLLPAHGSGDPAASAHAGNATHLSTVHAPSHHHAGSAAVGDDSKGGGSARHPQGLHQAQLHEAHAEVPLCHSEQTSSALTSPQTGISGSTDLVTALLAAGLVAVLVVWALTDLWGHTLPSSHRRRSPIRPEFGPRLLLLDCIARV